MVLSIRTDWMVIKVGKLVGPYHRNHFLCFFETKDFSLLYSHALMFGKHGDENEHEN